MKPKPKQPSDYVSATLASKARGKIPTCFLLLTNITTIVCEKVNFAEWEIYTWIIFLMPYLFLCIYCVLWLYHWHKKKCIEEKIALENFHFKQQQEKQMLKVEQKHENAKIDIQNNFFSHLAKNPHISEMSWGDNDLLGKNFHAKFDTSKSNDLKSNDPKKDDSKS